MENFTTSYIDLMHSQADDIYRRLSSLSDTAIWRKPSPNEWSIGENLDHLVVLNSTFLRLFKVLWVIEQPLARLSRGRSYPTQIDNVYQRPGMPQNVGWLWPPRYRPPHKTIPFSQLRDNLSKIHQQIEHFYAGKDQDLLGRIFIWDPAIGWLNLITGLRVGIYHDQLHFDVICQIIEEN